MFVYGATQFDPGLRFKTLETPHFSIHYHDGEQDLARAAAKIAEDVHEELTGFMRWQPRGKTQIVLLDIYDEANGLATPFPVNTIFAYTTQPGIGFDRYEDWFRLLITHEYTHILHMDTVRGFPALLRNIFGRWVFTNALQPIWQIEGLAVFNETEFTAGGRARGALYDGMLRLAVIENKLKRIDQAGTAPSSWPGGTTPYFYGGMFDSYLAQTYGRDKLVDFSQRYSGSVPFAQNCAAKKIFGKSYYQLWREWSGYLKDKYEKEAAEIKKIPLTQSVSLTNTGFHITAPAFSPDGKFIAYTEYNNREYPAVRLLDTANKKARTVVKGQVEPGIVWLPKGQGFLYSQGEVRNNFYYYDDIFYYDLKSRRTRQLTFGLRAKDPAISADGKKVVFVINKLGQNDLAVMDPYTAKLTVITQTKDHSQYSQPRFSPDSKLVAVSVWKPGGNQDLCLLDLESRQFAPLTNDPMIDICPAWSPDGKYLFFSSDRSGVYNIYAYSFYDYSIYQVTNVLGGAFYPAVSPDGKKIVFSNLGVNGLDLGEIDFDPNTWWKAPAFDYPVPERHYEPSQFSMKVHTYNPFPTLWPRMWLPMPVFDKDGWGPGFITFGMDVLQQHQFGIMAGVGWKSRRPYFDITYTNNQLYPQITVHALNLSYEDTPNWKHQQQGDVEVAVPFLSTKSYYNIVLGYHGERISDWNGLNSEIASGVSAGWRFDNTKRYSHSISRMEGGSVGVSVHWLDKIFGSDANSGRVVLEANKYFRLPLRNQVVALRLGAGIASDTTGFSVGGAQPFQLLANPIVRGDTQITSGGREFFLNLEYRFPLTWIERGPGTLPAFLSNTHGALFFDFGNAWSGKIPLFAEFKKSVGAELRSDLEFGWGWIPLTLRVGIVKTLGTDSNFQIFGGVSGPF